VDEQVKSQESNAQESNAQESNAQESNAQESNAQEAKQEQQNRLAECLSADFYSCEEAVKRLNEYLDHQLTAEEQVIVLKHLEICRPCLKRFSFEQTLVVSLRRKVLLLCVPSSLRLKLHGLLPEKE